MGSTPQVENAKQGWHDWWTAFHSDGFDASRGDGLLDQDLRSDLDDAVGRYAKVLGGIRRSACEPNKELLLPSRHIRFRCGSQGTSGQEEGRRRDIDVEPLAATLLQNLRYARRFHEAVVGGNESKRIADLADLDTLLTGNAWCILSLDGEDDIAFVQHV